MEPWSPLIALHAFCASLALVLGAFQLIRRRKGDRWHVLVGRAWTLSLLLTSSSSFWIGGYSAFMEWFLKALAVVSIVSVSIGWWAGRRRDVVTHAACMSGAYVGLLGAFVGVTVMPERRIPSAFRLHTEEAIFAALMIVAFAVVVILVAREVAASERRRPSPSGRTR